MKKYFYFICLFFFISINGFAQHPHAVRDYDGNHMFWFQGVLMGKIKDKWSYQLEVEYRRQADPSFAPDPGNTVGNSHLNIFKNPYQYAVRPFIHYQVNEKIRLSLSPLTWFGTYSFPVNGKVTYQPEYRWSPQVTLYNQYGRVQIQHRYRLEFRYLGLRQNGTNKADPTGPSSTYSFLNAGHQTRFRYLLRAIIPLNKTKIEPGALYLMTSSEIFLKGDQGVANANMVDQNRFYFNVGYKFHKHIRAEMGYLNQTAFRFNNKAKNNVDFNNNLFVTLIFEEFDIFKKKEIEQ